MQKAIMRSEQGATGLAGLAALLPRGTPLKHITASVQMVCAARQHLRRWFAPEGLVAHPGAKPPGICRRGATNIIHLRI